ncbi:MAG: RDD family protein [Bacteroidota bacterium]
MQDDILDGGFDGQNEIRNVEYASFWSRVGASLIDLLLFIPVIVVSVYNIISIQSFAFSVILSMVYIVYKPVMEWKYGATLGKMAVKIKVVNSDLEPITLEQSIMRFSLYLVNQMISIVSSYFLFSNLYGDIGLLEIGEVQQGDPLSAVSQLMSLVILVSVLFVAFDKERQALHDKIARTYCINT